MALKKWTKEEEEVLKEYAYAPMREIVALLPGRNRKTVYWKLSVMGFFRQTYRRYTAEEDLYILENYKTKGNREIAKHLKRTEKSVCKRMIVLGYKRTDDELKVMRGSNSGVFQKGRISEKAFSNGQLQLVYDSRANSSFYNIKINGKFHRFSRYLYEQFHNVELTKNDIVYHLDGNGMNVLKENLVCINRLDLMKNNINTDEAFVKRIFRIKDDDQVRLFIEKYPHVIALKKNTLKLNQQIKKNERETKII